MTLADWQNILLAAGLFVMQIHKTHLAEFYPGNRPLQQILTELPFHAVLDYC